MKKGAQKKGLKGKAKYNNNCKIKFLPDGILTTTKKPSYTMTIQDPAHKSYTLVLLERPEAIYTLNVCFLSS